MSDGRDRVRRAHGGLSATALPAPSTTGKPEPGEVPDARARAGVGRVEASATRTWTDVPFAGSTERDGAAREQERVVAARIARMRDRLGERDRDARRCRPAAPLASCVTARGMTGGAASVGVTALRSAALPARSVTPGPSIQTPGTRVAAGRALDQRERDVRAVRLRVAAHLHAEARRGRPCSTVCTGSEKRSVMASSSPSRSASPVSPVISRGETPSRVELVAARRRLRRACPPRTANVRWLFVAGWL